ncbi:MAG: serine/threonine-protein kinase, partial [Angustibacter sp.]
MTQPNQPPAAPVRLGPYRLAHRLGEGGMGVVHLAHDEQGRQVAIKVLRSHIAHDSEARARLAREVSTLRRVRHPLVADVLDADVEGERPYVVTRFVPGSGLDVVVRDQGPLAPESLLRLGMGLSSALAAIHSVSVVHRDLKPANVMMLDSDPVVIDFGIAHVADDVRLTSTGLVMGTPGYLSPEVIDGDPVTTATDWWGWAATLAFAASGRPPYGKGPMDVVIDRVRRGQCDLMGVDERLRPLLTAALAVDPQHRPVAREVLFALDRFAAGDSTTEHVVVHPNRIQPRVVDAAALAAASAPPRSVTRAIAQVPARGPSRAVPADRPAGAVAQPEPPAAEQPAAEIDRTWAILVGLLFVVIALAVAFPLLALAWSGLLFALARTVDHNRLSLLRRRARRGPRRLDVVWLTVGTPWHLARAVAMTVFTSLAPLALAAAVLFGAQLFLGLQAEVGERMSVALAALVAILAAWAGPGGQ